MTVDPVLLRTGPWRGTPLLRREAWLALEAASLIVGVTVDPYAAGLAQVGLPVDLFQSPAALRPALTGVPGACLVVDSGAVPALAEAIGRHTVVEGEPQRSGLGLLDVVAVMDRLRGPGGCPWDAQQTHASLRPYLLEEAQEAVEAIDSGDLAHLAEELGDVLLQVVFHARVGAEHPETPFDIDDVAATLVAKLVRRHPHVFAGVVAETPEQVAANWALIKAAERAAKQTGPEHGGGVSRAPSGAGSGPHPGR